MLNLQRNSYFAGTILTVCIVQIPQRFITVNGQSVFQAGVKLLPFGAFIPAGSTLAATLMGRGRIRADYILVAGGILEVVGTILLSKTSAEPQIKGAYYVYLILTGTGVGFFNAALILLVPHVLETRDLGQKLFDLTSQFYLLLNFFYSSWNCSNSSIQVTGRRHRPSDRDQCTKSLYEAEAAAIIASRSGRRST